MALAIGRMKIGVGFPDGNRFSEQGLTDSFQRLPQGFTRGTDDGACMDRRLHPEVVKDFLNSTVKKLPGLLYRLINRNLFPNFLSPWSGAKRVLIFRCNSYWSQRDALGRRFPMGGPLGLQPDIALIVTRRSSTDPFPV